MKKIIAVLLGFVMAFGLAAMAACSREPTEVLNEDGYYEGELKIGIVKAGYGTQWLYDIKNAYEQKFPGATVDITETADASNITGRIESSANEYDLVVLTTPVFSSQNNGYLFDLSEVFDSV